MSDLQATHAVRLIETDFFPIDFISILAERESWRKEIYRPIYHVHKWWAKRLGSVFRAILLGCLLPEEADFEQSFFQRHDSLHAVVFDPFMGSGTTIGEAHKLGCIALGRDINPVACESVRVALGPLDRRELQRAFWRLSSTVGEQLHQLYQTEDETGRTCDVLYYFWVKTTPCLHCGADVDLFPTYIMARNAYSHLKPEIQVLCPCCGDVFRALITDERVNCRTCGFDFDPRHGPAGASEVVCSHCAESFSILNAVRATKETPHHRLYAKLILTPEQTKQYMRTTSRDRDDYERASANLRDELTRGAIRLPDAQLSDGHNTHQVLNYNYHHWRDFFNDRQLLALGWLQDAIAQLPDDATRDAMLLLFSGVLEFNNLFATYKGEGTGAVRHMFSHHILKPERMPIEANVWGTAKSSGSFTNLFNNRLTNALNYREAPFETSLNGAGKVHSTSHPFSGKIEQGWPENGQLKPRGIYLSCGNSVDTALPDHSVDFVVTDPPFFDNVHYSELADFFFAWQALYPHGFIQSAPSTRREGEVQDVNPERFAAKLGAVFSECRRILKDDGLLAFTYHHSRAEGWLALIKAIFDAGFSVVNAHPVKSELSVASPKSQAADPIQIDVILVCKKSERDLREPLAASEAATEAVRRSRAKLQRLALVGLELTRSDRRVTLFSQFIAALGPAQAATAIQSLSAEQAVLEAIAEHGIDPTEPLHNVLAQPDEAPLEQFLAPPTA